MHEGGRLGPSPAGRGRFPVTGDDVFAHSARRSRDRRNTADPMTLGPGALRHVRLLLASCRPLPGEMCARARVVRDVVRQHAVKARRVHRDHVIELLASDRADHAFHVGVLPRRSRRRSHVLNMHPLESRRDVRKDRAVDWKRGVLAVAGGDFLNVGRFGSFGTMWPRSTGSPRFPISGALRRCEVRPKAGSRWTSRESRRGHRLACPAPRAMSALPHPEQAKAAPMPGERRRWLHDMERERQPRHGAPATPRARSIRRW